MASVFRTALLIYHLVFSYIAWRTLIIKKGDAYRYWFVGKDLSGETWFQYLNPGTDVIQLITFPFVKYFDLPFWSGFLIFSALSGVGVWLLCSILMTLADGNRWLQYIASILLLLPNLHFWTSIPGKEAVVFVILVLLLQKYLTRQILSTGSAGLFVILVLIRPHIGGVFLAALVPAIIFGVEMQRRSKVIFTLGSTVAAGAAAVILNRILRGDYPLFENIKRYYRVHTEYFKHTDAYVPLDQYILPYKIFTFWFRPLPLEERGLFYTVVSAENTVFLLICCGALYGAVKYFRKRTADRRIVFLILFVLFFTLMYVYAYANYGIIMRTRIMAFPFIAVLIMMLLRPGFRTGERD